MRTVSSAREVILDERAREQLEAFARSRSLPHALVVRAKLVLMASDGAQSRVIAKHLGLNRHTVGKWRGRFAQGGIEGLYDEYRSGQTAEHRRRADIAVGEQDAAQQARRGDAVELS